MFQQIPMQKEDKERDFNIKKQSNKTDGITRF